MTESERLRKALDHLKYKHEIKSDSALSKKLGYKRSYLSQVRNGKVPISNKFYGKLIRLDNNINIDWISNGKGKMLVDKQPDLPGTTKVYPKHNLSNEGLQPYNNGGPCNAPECITERKRLLSRINDLEAQLIDKNELLEFYRQRDKKENSSSTGT